MPQLLERNTPVEGTPEKDFLPLNGTDYVEFYVGNARQSAHYYRSAFGFRLAAYRGPETGTRDRASYVLAQHKIRLVLTTPLRPDHAITEQIRLHGDGVHDIALWVDDAEAAWRETTRRGARSVHEPETRRDENGEVRRSRRLQPMATRFTALSNVRIIKGVFLPGYRGGGQRTIPWRGRLDCLHIDHMVGNVGWGEMDRWVDFYHDVMGFRLFRHFDDKDISTEYSAGR